MTRAIRYAAAGDDSMMAELDQEMSLETNIRVTTLTKAIAARDIAGITDVCPANISYMVRFNPDVTDFETLLPQLRAAETELPDDLDLRLESRVIELPVLYADPWTHEAVVSSRTQHQDPDATDLEFAARQCGYTTVEQFVAAHEGSPWYVTMTGFVPGAAWYYQMVPRERQIEVPKYLRPRTNTPARAVGHGGAFGCIYPVAGAGGYQLFGISAGPVLDTERLLPDFEESMALVRPGDIIKFRAVDEAEYHAIRAEVDRGSFRFHIQQTVFEPRRFVADPLAYNAALLAECLT